MAENRASTEDKLIAEHFAPLADGWPGAFGLRDDCASILPAPGQEIIVKTDPVRWGVHFLDDRPEDIAWKALAVNVSDLAAKSARPLGYLLAASFPVKPDDSWLTSFAAGLSAAQNAFGCRLIGGDTDRADGPLSVAGTIFGECPAHRMIRRDTAQAGDILYVSGTLGDAALGLALRIDSLETEGWELGADARSALLGRYFRPAPRLGLKSALRNFARAAMDLSDGLAKDLGRMCRASRCGADVDLGAVPVSAEMELVQQATGQSQVERVVAGGDDYEVLAAVAPDFTSDFEAAARAGGVAVRRIGHLHDGDEVRFLGSDGRPLELAQTGYDHF